MHRLLHSRIGGRWRTVSIQDSCYVLIDTTSDREFMPSQDNMIFRQVYFKRKNAQYGDRDIWELGGVPSSHYVASAFKINRGNQKHIQYHAKSVVKFDLSSIPPNSTVISAVLNLKAQAPRTLWVDQNKPELNFFAAKTKAHFIWGDTVFNSVSVNNTSLISRAGLTSSASQYDHVLPATTQFATVTNSQDFTCTDKAVTVTSLVAGMVIAPSTNYGFLMNLRDRKS